jgi:hypothetical protein
VRVLLLQAGPPERTIIKIMCSWRGLISRKVTSVKRFDGRIAMEMNPLFFLF